MKSEREASYGGAGTDRRVWDCGSPLYDSYELASLSHLLDRHTMEIFLAAPSSSSSSGQLTKSTAAEESKGRGRRLGMKKAASRRRTMGKFGNAVRAAWVAVANYRSKRVVPK